jgi:hypothetical protein
MVTCICSESSLAIWLKLSARTSASCAPASFYSPQTPQLPSPIVTTPAHGTAENLVKHFSSIKVTPERPGLVLHEDPPSPTPGPHRRHLLLTTNDSMLKSSTTPTNSVSPSEDKGDFFSKMMEASCSKAGTSQEKNHSGKVAPVKIVKTNTRPDPLKRKQVRNETTGELLIIEG